MNIDELNSDPTPDPDWDYSEIWHGIQTAARDLKDLMEYMAAIEDATPQSDAQIKAQLDNIGQTLSSSRGLINL